MKTLKEIHSEAKNYSESEPLQDAFVVGARWAITGNGTGSQKDNKRLVCLLPLTM